MVQLKYRSNGVPVEDWEEAQFASWLDVKGIKHTHLSNETYTRSWNQKRKMKDLGVHSGIADHICIVPNKLGVIELVFIEMKVQKGGVVSDDQWDWLSDLRTCVGVRAYVAEGHEKAEEIIQKIIDCDYKWLEEKDDEFWKKYYKNKEKRRKNAEKTKNSLPY